jgi:hypothetical protein
MPCSAEPINTGCTVVTRLGSLLRVMISASQKSYYILCPDHPCKSLAHVVHINSRVFLVHTSPTLRAGINAHAAQGDPISNRCEFAIRKSGMPGHLRYDLTMGLYPFTVVFRQDSHCTMIGRQFQQLCGCIICILCGHLEPHAKFPFVPAHWDARIRIRIRKFQHFLHSTQEG